MAYSQDQRPDAQQRDRIAAALMNVQSPQPRVQMPPPAAPQGMPMQGAPQAPPPTLGGLPPLPQMPVPGSPPQGQPVPQMGPPNMPLTPMPGVPVPAGAGAPPFQQR